jgi:colanic acid/amylovoran/stewartan biosynthesis glycosyltransferase WcaL/AmsK/CpsK
MRTDNPPRLALFCTNFLPASQVFVYEQLRQYRRWQADVFAWRRFNADRFVFPRVIRAGPGYILYGKSRRFERAFAQHPYRLVHAHFGPAGAYARRYAARAGLPLLVTFHGYDVPLLSSARRYLPLHLPYALGGPALLRDMRLGICASTELLEMLARQGVDRERLCVHRLGIDLDRFAFSPTRGGDSRQGHDVLMVGRLVEKKGFEYGLGAFALARARGIDARLTIVGEGERRAALERLARELGIADRVRFAGALSNEAVAATMAESSVLLAPSVVARDGNRESGLIVVKEAAARGTVPIATRHGGIPDSIDDEQTGYLVEERDAEHMGERLVQVLTDEPLRARLAQAGRRKMEREFDNRKLVAELEEIYDRVARERAPTARMAPVA